MNTIKVKQGCSSEQKRIITEYFSGVTFKELVKKYSASHTVKSESTGKEIVMPKDMAERKIYKALSYIDWSLK